MADRGVLTTHIRSDGRYKDKLYVDGGAGSTGTVGLLRMEGKEVFRHAVVNLAETVRHTFAETGLTGADIDWFVPHQANRRIIDATADKLGIGHERVVVTVDRHGNTSAASIPLALAEAHTRWPHQARPARADRGDGRRLHLGLGADPLVSGGEFQSNCPESRRFSAVFGAQSARKTAVRGLTGLAAYA